MFVLLTYLLILQSTCRPRTHSWRGASAWVTRTFSSYLFRTKHFFCEIDETYL